MTAAFPLTPLPEFRSLQSLWEALAPVSDAGTLGSVWADCILAEWLIASTRIQGHLSHSISGAVLTWFQWLCLVSKQKLFRWEQIQLESSVIFTRPSISLICSFLLSLMTIWIVLEKRNLICCCCPAYVLAPPSPFHWLQLSPASLPAPPTHSPAVGLCPPLMGNA